MPSETAKWRNVKEDARETPARATGYRTDPLALDKEKRTVNPPTMLEPDKDVSQLS